MNTCTGPGPAAPSSLRCPTTIVASLRTRRPDGRRRRPAAPRAHEPRREPGPDARRALAARRSRRPAAPAETTVAIRPLRPADRRRIAGTTSCRSPMRASSAWPRSSASPSGLIASTASSPPLQPAMCCVARRWRRRSTSPGDLRARLATWSVSGRQPAPRHRAPQPSAPRRAARRAPRSREALRRADAATARDDDVGVVSDTPPPRRRRARGPGRPRRRGARGAERERLDRGGGPPLRRRERGGRR